MTVTPTDLLRQHWDGTLPVNVIDIAEKLGIKVTGEFGMTDNASGCIERHPNGSFEITYDITEAQVRQRFTIAHEIGHYALGHLNEQHRCFRDHPTNFMSNAQSAQERQANAFAAELLMPESIVTYAIQKKGVTKVTELANVFNVSQAAMSYRLKNIGIIR